MPAIQTYSSKGRASAGVWVKGAPAEEKCPICGSTMEVKNGRNGVFWGCSRWPDCAYTKDYVEIDFRNGGIVVINQQSTKGLEFETVFIADVDKFTGRDEDELMKKFYVMVSRAREDAVLLRDNDTTKSDAVERILPNENIILERR
jgi:ssDNA-binding Zn-finger/Zn-ribbon topoisomerase 1